jgi:putative transcriptional regulator
MIDDYNNVMASEGFSSLAGDLLLALPGIGDPRFAQAVIAMCLHQPDGAMGVGIGQLVPGLKLHALLRQLEIEPGSAPDAPIHLGGPVDPQRGFVLHSSDYQSGNTYPVTPGVSLTATVDILRAVAFGPAPKASLFALGCCAWSPDQLEGEIASNGWLTVPFSRELIFDTPVEDRYEAALASLHITRATLSPDAGHA